MIETKKVLMIGSYGNKNDFRELANDYKLYVEDLQAFGWQPTEEISERFGRTTSRYQILARQTDMPNYDQYVNLEDRYEDAKSSMKYYESMSFSTAGLLLLLLVVPGILYIAFKISQKKNIKENNERCFNIMKQAVNEAREIK